MPTTDSVADALRAVQDAAVRVDLGRAEIAAREHFREEITNLHAARILSQPFDPVIASGAVFVASFVAAIWLGWMGVAFGGVGAWLVALRQHHRATTHLEAYRRREEDVLRGSQHADPTPST